MALRDYQIEWKNGIYAAWNSGARNVMGILPTGGGKTTSFCSLLTDQDAPACVVAHRQELVSQASLALNHQGIPHGIIAADAVIREIVKAHMHQDKVSHFNPRANIRVAGVDTLVRRQLDKDKWFSWVKNVVMDEGHHVLAANKWGRAMGLFRPDVRGLFATAHAIRADGAGLGRADDGLADALVVGPSYRDLVNRGYLCDYRLICPPSDMRELTDQDIGDKGEYKQDAVRAAFHDSKTIIGDVPQYYRDIAGGKLGLTFTPDIQAAKDIQAAYWKREIRAELITGTTPIHVRAQLMEKFRDRDILQLISVDVLGEGTDVPAVEVVSFARHTASFQLFAQQWGRSARVMVEKRHRDVWDRYTDDQRKQCIAQSVKPRGIVIDHVGNWERFYKIGYGLPCKRQEYTLERTRRKKLKNDDIPMRRCLNKDKPCFEPYPRVLAECPHCGMAAPPPAQRSTPEFVDGDLYELDPETLAALQGEVARVDSLVANVPEHLKGTAAELALRRNHRERQAGQLKLRHVLGLYGGWMRQQGKPDSESYKRFFFQFGIDVLTAQSLNATKAAELTAQIETYLTANGVVDVTPGAAAA